MYYDLYLKFNNEAESNSVLFTELSYTEGDEIMSYKLSMYAAVDVIGIMLAPTGNIIVTDEGDIPEMVAVEGWHVNVRHTSPALELSQWELQVNSPQRVWA